MTSGGKDIPLEKVDVGVVEALPPENNGDVVIQTNLQEAAADDARIYGFTGHIPVNAPGRSGESIEDASSESSSNRGLTSWINKVAGQARAGGAAARKNLISGLQLVIDFVEYFSRVTAENALATGNRNHFKPMSAVKSRFPLGREAKSIREQLRGYRIRLEPRVCREALALRERKDECEVELLGFLSLIYQIRQLGVPKIQVSHREKGGLSSMWWPREEELARIGTIGPMRTRSAVLQTQEVHQTIEWLIGGNSATYRVLKKGARYHSINNNRKRMNMPEKARYTRAENVD
ncbi:hypothetical protein B0J17DRAFT_710382 [Rhizoctonia solani]|nr:hypothetical protein B0J17DRAFT_710382 [Rhizoctonia solani]